jgi:hypothetical protein
MPSDLSAIHVDPDQFPVEPLPCLRCGAVTPMRFRGPCPQCAAELRDKYRGEARVVAGAEYEPVMHVTPNAVALKDD